MRYVAIITGVYIFFLPNVCLSQYVSPQISIDEINKNVKTSSSDSLISSYILISQPYETFLATKNYCDNLVRYGAQPPSQNYRQMMNLTIPKVLKEINECHTKKTGKKITKELIKSYKESNPDGARDLLEMFNSIGQLGGLNSVPKTKSDLENCAANEIYANLYLKAFYQSTGYPNKNWCTNHN